MTRISKQYPFGINIAVTMELLGLACIAGVVSQRIQTMGKEIDILLEANRQGYLIVDKDSHVLLERDELEEARANGLYQEEGVLFQERSLEVSSPFPGCLQLGAATEHDLDYRLLGQTRHFVIFIPAKRQVSGPRALVF